MNPENTRSKRTVDRRTALKTTGVAVFGIAGFSSSGAAESGTAAPEAVTVSDSASAERFLERLYRTAQNAEQVHNAYERLSDDEFDLVMEVLREPLVTDTSLEEVIEKREELYNSDEITASDWENVTLSDWEKVSGGDDYHRDIGDYTVHETEHTLEFEYNGSGIRNEDNDSSGTAPAPAWYHEGLRSSHLNVLGDEVVSSRVHEYRHEPGVEVRREATVIDLRGHADGTIETVNKQIIEL
ncbi:hypothetical protein AB7C87_03810 [Natrarchaeobius sp. A-rgal3]|uniref:hypothetical protein n=1 Tax=Natrarchaeobius versutus TaxID=1679078 RepID=UPI00350F38E8